MPQRLLGLRSGVLDALRLHALFLQKFDPNLDVRDRHGRLVYLIRGRMHPGRPCSVSLRLGLAGMSALVVRCLLGQSWLRTLALGLRDWPLHRVCAVQSNVRSCSDNCPFVL